MERGFTMKRFFAPRSLRAALVAVIGITL